MGYDASEKYEFHRNRPQEFAVQTQELWMLKSAVQKKETQTMGAAYIDLGEQPLEQVATIRVWSLLPSVSISRPYNLIVKAATLSTGS